MNPRDFCREPGYDRAVLFTYDFDALFFERIVLRDLLAGGTTDIQVVADLSRILEVQARWIGQVRGLGKRYRLDFATLSGAFHPKVLFRAGVSGAIIWVGSGNITYGGWQSNLEVGTVWRVGPGLQDQGAWLDGVLQELARWIPSEKAAFALERFRTATWLPVFSDEPLLAPVLISQETVPLGSQLAARWAGRTFDEVTIATGSTDEGGALLAFFYEQFGVSKAKILLSPESTSFDADKLGALPLTMQLLQPSDHRRVHAKCYWFTGPSGSAAIVGSANCSRAAWLLSPKNGGNVESIVVYDNPKDDDFAAFLSRFSKNQTRPVELGSLSATEKTETLKSAAHQVAEVSWEPTRGELAISFTTPLPPSAQVAVELCGKESACQVTSDDRLWITLVDPILLKSKLSATGYVTILTGLEQSRQMFWINDLGELRSFAEGRRFTDAIEGFRHARSATEQHKAVNALQFLAHMILDQPPTLNNNLSGSSRRSTTRATATDDSTVKTTDPEALIRSLNDLINLPKAPQNAYSLHGVSLLGVMRAFFANSDDQTDLTPLAEPETGGGVVPRIKPSSIETLPPPPPTVATRKKLYKQLNAFVIRLREDDFAESCSVEQMVQAVAFPLGVIAYGLEGGWFDVEDAHEIVRAVLDTLFWQSYANRAVGLLDLVQKRYDRINESQNFQDAAGDGTLWAVMLAAVWKTPWLGLNDGIQKGLAMRCILRSQSLLSTASVGRMEALLRGLSPMFSPSAVMAEGSKFDLALTRLENYTVTSWDRLVCEQRTMVPRVRAGDAYYHRDAGWVFTIAQPERPAKNGFSVYRPNRAEKMIAIYDFYLNLSQLAEREEFIAKWFKEGVESARFTHA